MNNKIAVTGSRGLLGSLLVNFLKKKKISFVEYKDNLNDLNKLKLWLNDNKDIKYFFHFAAISSPITSEKNKNLTKLTNITSLKNLINCLKKREIWFFFPSTSHVYGSSKYKISENFKIKPSNYYGKTKFIGEKFLQKNKNNKLNICIGRIFSVYHKKQKIPFLLPSVKKRLKNKIGKYINIKNGNSVRDFNNADNVIKIIYKLSILEAKGVYNIGTGKGQTIINFLKKEINTNKIFIPIGQKNSIVANINKLQNKINEKI